MTDRAGKIASCVSKIAERVDRLDESPVGLSDAPFSHLRVILREAGYQKISATNLSVIQDALTELHIFCWPNLEDPSITRDSRIYFSRDEGTFAGLASPRALFSDEASLQAFIEKNFEHLKAFEHLEFRASQYPVDPPAGFKVDILAVDRRSRELVAIELKYDAPDKGMVYQVASYVKSLKKLADREKRPGVRGLIITGQPDRRVLECIQEIARGADIRIDWVLYRVELDLRPVPVG